MKDTIKITCYGQTEEWTDRNKAIAFYREGMSCSEGSERDRYTQIFLGLIDGKTVISDEDGF